MFGPSGRRREWPRRLPLIGGGAPLGRINRSLWWRLRGQGNAMGFSSLGLTLGGSPGVYRPGLMHALGRWLDVVSCRYNYSSYTLIKNRCCVSVANNLN